MRRALRYLLPLALAAVLGACQAKTQNVPVGSYGNTVQQQGEAVIVGSLSTLGLSGVADGKRLHFVFQAYDPATKRLIAGGPTFEMVRETCRNPGPACDPTQPYHQVVTLPPGHYALVSTHLFGEQTPIQSSGSVTTHFYVPVKTSFWGKSLPEGASVSDAETIDIEVGPGEVVYFGDLSVDRPDDGQSKRYYSMVFDVERDDEAAKAALTAAGIDPSAMIWRPAT